MKTTANFFVKNEEKEIEIRIENRKVIFDLCYKGDGWAPPANKSDH